MPNIFEHLPDDLSQEVFQDIVKSENIRIERIVSKGHASPVTGWYDQDENEWVMVMQGAARLGFEDGHEVDLKAGDHVTIPSHVKHKVLWSDPEQITIWLAMFYT